MRIKECKKAVKTAQLEEPKVSTDYNMMEKNKYISFFVDNSFTGNAPDAQLEEQRSNKSCLHRLPSSILGWGAHPALLNFKESIIKVDNGDKILKW